MSSKRQYQQRLALESDLGVRAPGPYHEVDLPGADLAVSRPMAASNRARPDLVPRRGVTGPGGVTFQATTDFGWRYGGEPILHQSAFGAAPLAAVSTSATGISAGDHAIVRTGGWVGTGVSAGQIFLVTGAQGANPGAFLAPIVEIDGDLAKLHPDFGTLADETVALQVHHAGIQKVGSDTYSMTFESWNPATQRGDEVLGMVASQWGISGTYTQSGPQPYQQTFSLAALERSQLDAQIAVPTTSAPELLAFNSGSSFQDTLNPLAGLGFRFNGTLLDEILFDSVQLQLQAQVRNRSGMGHDTWKRIIKDQDIAITLTITFGRRERPGYTHQDLIIAAAEGKEPASIGFGWRDESGRRAYVYLPVLEVESLRLPGLATSGDDQVSITYKAYAEETPLWGPLCLSWLDAV